MQTKSSFYRVMGMGMGMGMGMSMGMGMGVWVQRIQDDYCVFIGFWVWVWF